MKKVSIMKLVLDSSMIKEIIFFTFYSMYNVSKLIIATL